MPLPFVIDNQQHRLADARRELLAQSAGKPLDIGTTYFATASYRLVKGASGLAPDERALLGSTRPVRDPLDVLEAKIRGGEEAETEKKTEVWAEGKAVE